MRWLFWLALAAAIWWLYRRGRLDGMSKSLQRRLRDFQPATGMIPFAGWDRFKPESRGISNSLDTCGCGDK